MQTQPNAHSRRWLLAAAGATAVGAQSARAQAALAANPLFGSLKQQAAGVLSIGYAETGPAAGPPAILLHGWPYDMTSKASPKPFRCSPRLDFE